MRTYANFLLFEDVLTSLPTGSVLIQNAANMLMNPTVSIIEADCGTLLGEIHKVDYTLEGQIELASGSPITINRVKSLMTQGVTNVRVRTIHSCISKGGICGTCYQATFGIVPRTLNGTWTLDGFTPLNGVTTLTAGVKVLVPSEFIYKTDVIIGDGVNITYPLSQNTSQYTRTSYNPVLHPEVVSITNTSITFNAVRTTNDVFALHYYNVSSNPFLEYIAKSYSGGFLGIAPLPSYPTLLKPSLYQAMFSESQLQLLRNELNAYSGNIPPTYLSYCDTIKDPLEKVLMIIYLYAIYANVQ